MNKHASYQDLRAHLAYLKLAAIAEHLPSALEAAEREKPGYTQFLHDLLAVEVDATEQRRLAGRMRFAGFPSTKTLEEFDFTAQPGIDRAIVNELATLRFVEEKANVLLIGPPDPVSHCPPRCRHWSNSPASASDTLILRPFRRPLTTWTASSSPRWTLCKTVCRAQPRLLAASSSGRYPSGTLGTNRERVSSVRRIRQGACGVVCSPGSRPSLSHR